MIRWLSALSAVGLAFAMFSSPVFPNSAVYQPPEVPLKITADNRTRENRLVIPRRFLTGANVGSIGAPLGGGDARVDLRTVVAGLAISVALISLVFLVLKKKSRSSRTIALLIAAGGVGFFAWNSANADVAPPISEIPNQWKSVAASEQNVTIEIVDRGDAVELILGTEYRGRGGDPRNDEPKPPGDGSAPPDGNAKPE